MSRELYLQSEGELAATESPELQFLNKFDEASNTVKSSFLEAVQRTLDKGTALVSKRVKLADKSEFG